MNEQFKLINKLQPMIEEQTKTLRVMIRPNGAVLASPHGNYKAHWIRDGLYALKGMEYLGLDEDVYRMIRAPFTIFRRYEAKIHEGIRKKPDQNYKFLHTRYHPVHFTELTGDWGHNQLDVLGLFLFEVADLMKKNITVFSRVANFNDTYLINQITRYLETLEWWNAPDFGVWEEGPELHSSSIGAVLGGLIRLKELNDPRLFFDERQIEYGKEALAKLLPRESQSDSPEPDQNRKCDMAQLSLIWPYRVVDDAQTKLILENIENNLVGKYGVKRYPNDAYYNGADDRLELFKDPKTGLELMRYKDGTHGFPFKNAGQEAEWPMGFAWLAIVYAKLAKREFEKHRDYHHYQEKAKHYLDKCIGTAVPCKSCSMGYLPELYTKGKPNINTPLTWTTAFFIIAAISYLEIEDPFVPFVHE